MGGSPLCPPSAPGLRPLRALGAACLHPRPQAGLQALAAAAALVYGPIPPPAAASRCLSLGRRRAKPGRAPPPRPALVLPLTEQYCGAGGSAAPSPARAPREGAGSPGWGSPAGLSGAVFSPLPLPQRRWGPSCERGTGREGRGAAGAACATGAAPARRGRPGSPRSSLCLGHVPAGPTSPSRCPCAAQPFVHFSTPLAPTQHNLPGACARLKGSLYLRLPNHCEWGAALCRAEF